VVGNTQRVLHRLVLLHGWTSSAEITWGTALPALRAHYDVVAPDLRGHGEGPRGSEVATLHACARDVASLISEMAGPPILVGYSMGGAISQLVARDHPELVGAIVLCASAERFRITWREWSRHVGLVAASRVARLLPETVTGRAALATMEHLFGDSGVQRSINERMRAHSWREVLEIGVSVGHFDSRSWVGSLETPAASVVTTKDDHVPPARQLRLAADLGAPVFPVAGGHAVCISDPDRFVPPLLEACAYAARCRRSWPVVSGARIRTMLTEADLGRPDQAVGRCGDAAWSRAAPNEA
jgi:pimeloyl-ACP methyl ester carboxylesterase